MDFRPEYLGRMRADPVSRPSALASLVPRFLRPGIKRLIGYERAMQRRSFAAREQQGLKRHPRLLTEKIVYKMAYDRRPILSTFADKVAVRDYVASRVGPEALVRVITIVDSAEEIDWAALPEQYVAKATHGSGGNVIVARAADARARLPQTPIPGRWGSHLVRREHADPARMMAVFAEWLSLDYADVHDDPVREWCYDAVPRRVLVEDYLEDGSGNPPPDFKLFMLNGRCRYIQFDTNRARDHHRDTMTPDWEPIAVEFGYPRSAVPLPRPENLPRMIEIAEALADGIDFVRVDLYSVDGRVVVGELTNYPEAGRVRFRPQSFDRKMGRLLTLADYR